MSEPIRILQVMTHMNRGGLETMIMNYYRNIDRDLVQFDFLTHRPYDGDYGEQIRALGGRIYHLPVLNPLSGAYLKALDSFFAEHNTYKVVHVHLDCMSAVVLNAAKKYGVPVRIAHSHCASQDKNWKMLIKVFYMRKIPGAATELLACGREAGNWMFFGNRFSVLNNAIDVRKYIFDPVKRNEMRQNFGISEKTLLMGHVGRFSAVKNHMFLIDILRAAIKKYPETKLLLVGNDQEGTAQDVKAKVKAFGLQDRVIFTGLRGDVPEVLQAMDVFLFPSFFEGLPVSILEAQASGLPCLMSEAVTLESKLTEAVEQLSLDLGPAYWAEKAIDMARDFVRIDTGKQIVAAGYDIKANAKRLQDYYIACAQGKAIRFEDVSKSP